MAVIQSAATQGNRRRTSARFRAVPGLIGLAQSFLSGFQLFTLKGERAKSQMWLWPKLEERGVMKDKTRMGFTYRGIGLLDMSRNSDNV